jgi:energy-coupling factor transport system ATP-binding protein
MQNIIEINNLTFQYDSNSPDSAAAVEDINLQIQKGSFTVILGHNGSGKSTLAKLLNGLLLPTKGSVSVDGLLTTDENNIFNIRRKLGMVFQNPDNQIVCTVVEEDVAFGPENLGLEPFEIRKRVDNALKTVDMNEYRLAAPDRLSGGQKQRVALAGILAMEPECIVLDEPTAMLDPKGRKEVIDTITRLNKEKGITVILITHFMEEAENADRVIVMDSGKITADGSLFDVFSNTDLILRAGLALPQSVELLSVLRAKGLNVKPGYISPKAAAKEIYRALKGGTL